MTNMKHQQGWTLTTPEGVTVAVSGELTLAGFLIECVGENPAARRMIDVLAHEYREWGISYSAVQNLMTIMALPYADRPGYREEWRP